MHPNLFAETLDECQQYLPCSSDLHYLFDDSVELPVFRQLKSTEGQHGRGKTSRQRANVVGLRHSDLLELHRGSKEFACSLGLLIALGCEVRVCEVL